VTRDDADGIFPPSCVAHYSAEQWTFAKGALCTFDRKFFGPIGKHVLHGICETHVAHHISSKIPHYHAWEATEAIKNFVGEYYHYTDENFLVSIWNNYRQCRVSLSAGVYSMSYGCSIEG
jgi:omega-6 fatty acid desaturase (delta-12 desaturase)